MKKFCQISLLLTLLIGLPVISFAQMSFQDQRFRLRAVTTELNEPVNFTFSLPEKFLNSTSPDKKRAPGGKKIVLPSMLINFDMLGLLELGPIIQLEIKLYDRLYLVPWLRYSYAGLASQYVWTDFEDGRKYSPASFGFALGFKEYWPLEKRKRLIYTGIFCEYSYDKAWREMDTRWESEQTRNGIAALANVGYHWRIKRNFFLNLGVIAGVSFDLENQSVYTTEPNYIGVVERDAKATRFVGVVEFAFGWVVRQ